MYVYIWRGLDGVPFYVGMGSKLRRADPRTKGHRNKKCLQRLQEIGADNVRVEIRFCADETEAKTLEMSLIKQFGKIRDCSGTLTNVSDGGEFHPTTEKTRKHLKELWQDPKYREKTVTARRRAPRDLAPSTKNAYRLRLLQNPHMRGWGERNGKDPEFDAKRIAGIRNAQTKRAEKMRDPAALEQRKARLRATLASEEYKAKRAAYDTPEYRKKLADAKRAYWAAKKAV